MRYRTTLGLLLVAVLSSHVVAQEDGARASDRAVKSVEAAPVAARVLALGAEATTVVPGVTGAGWMVGLKSGALLGVASDGRTTWTVRASEDPVRTIRVSRDSTLVAAASGASLRVFDVKTRTMLWSGPVPVAFGFGAKSLVLHTISANGNVNRWGARTGKAQGSLEIPSRKKILHATIGPNGAYAVLGSHESG